MKRPINVEVEARRNESIDRLLKRFAKKIKKELIFEEVRERMYYEKPSERKKREKQENIKRSKKIQRMKNNF